jgi:transcriptional regulator with XRE-family HTH domain
MSTPEHPGSLFRLHRESRGQSVRSLAKALKLSPSLVSLIERGKQQPSATFVDRYQQLYGFPPGYIHPTKISPQISSVLRILSLFNTMASSVESFNVQSFFDQSRNTLSLRKKVYSQSFNDDETGSFKHAVDNDIYTKIDALLELTSCYEPQSDENSQKLADVAAHPENTVIFISQGRDLFYHYKELRNRWNSLISRIIEAGWFFHQYLRLNGDQIYNLSVLEDIVHDTLFHEMLASRCQERRLLPAGRFATSCFPNTGLKETPYDFISSPNVGLLMLYTRLRHNEVDSAILLEPPPSSLSSHCTLITRSADRAVQYFRSLNVSDAMLYSEMLSATDEIPGPRLVVQPYFSSITRPYTDLQRGSPWFKRKLKYFGSENSVLKLIQHRERRIRAMERQLSEHRYDQICSLEEIRFWALHGYGTHSGEVEQEIPQEYSWRINRLRRVLQLMEEKKEKFRIALVRKEDEHLFGWDTSQKKNITSWMVKVSSNMRVAVETRYKCNGAWQEDYMIFFKSCLDESFEEAFRHLWDVLPSSSTQQSVVKDTLRSIQQEVEMLESRQKKKAPD